jgi:transcriptional regulator with XRE-family HTH domain
MENERKRGNPAGATNVYLSENLRRARSGIGMDLRTFADRIKATGRMMSAAALSKIENGDRRVDVDDLTVFAYILGTTPAALLTPPEHASPEGVPASQYTPEELREWIAGNVKLTTDDLIRYWKEQAFSSASYIHASEEVLTRYDRGQVGITPREVYEGRIAAHKERLAMIRTRQLELDPLAVTIED